jgi:hypothetical protein
LAEQIKQPIYYPGFTLGGIGSGFFSFGMKQEDSHPTDRTKLRNGWEYSDVARAAFAFLSLIALVIAISLNSQMRSK